MIKVTMNQSGMRQLEREIAQNIAKEADRALQPLRRAATTMKGHPAEEVRTAVLRAARSAGIQFDPAELESVVETIAGGDDQEFKVRVR
jgi:hypothetical protein